MSPILRLGAVALLLAGCGSDPEAAAPEVEPLPDDALPAALAARLGEAGLAVRVLDTEGEAYALVAFDLDDEEVLLQWADLGEVAIGQVLGPEAAPGDDVGAYHPLAPSPAFAALDADSVVAGENTEAGLLAVINGAFYEELGAATRLAFPAAVGGEVVSGGSSPRGPLQQGAEGERWGRPLKVLALADTVARIDELDPTTGDPFDAPAFADAFASYGPETHPTRGARRFHAAGALDGDGDGVSEGLVVLTNSGRSTLDDLSAVLDRLGVDDTARIAPDGGASVFVWNRRAGVLHRPEGDRPLPHYLTLRLR